MLEAKRINRTIRGRIILEDTPTQGSSASSQTGNGIPSRDWRNERFLIALLLTISFAVLVWNTKYFTIRKGRVHKPNFTFSYNLASCVTLAVFLTLTWF